MKTTHETWTVKDLRETVHEIEYPEFQREPTIWDLEKKQRLIDSILREFDISSVYFHLRDDGQYDCIDGRQRINAILSYLGINGSDLDHNGFNLRIENEIYLDKAGVFDEVQGKRYENLTSKWKKKIDNHKLNVVLVSGLQHESELNLLFLRLQIASVLNAGEKLHAMTGEMRDLIFDDLAKYKLFKKIAIPSRRFAKEQVTGQIVLNVFGRKNDSTFKRARYTDLQEFFRQNSRLVRSDQEIIEEIKHNLRIIAEAFSNKLAMIRNRAMAVSMYLFVSDLIQQGEVGEINLFVEFLEKFLKTLKWQIPQGVRMNKAYYDLLNFQTSISQAAGEKTAIQNRHSFLGEYFLYFRKNRKAIKGDLEYQKTTKRKPDNQRKAIKI